MNINKKYTCVIVDDEPHCIDSLKNYITNTSYLELIKAYDNPIDAVREIAISKSEIDFLFLDIDMPRMSGLEVASIIRHKVDKLIFVTGHRKYSLEAYDVQCNQYLLKPYSEQKFVDTINKLIEAPKQEFGDQNEDSLFLKLGSSKKYIQVKCDDIISINAMEHYVIVETNLNKYVQHTSMKEVEYSLRNNTNFIRVHKSHIISKKHILTIQGNNIVLTNNFEIVIGITFRSSFTRFLEKNSLT